MIHPIRKRKRFGPKPAFAESDVARFLWLLQSGGRKSRAAVAKALGIGEGSVRTLISFLRQEAPALIEVKRRGCALTRSGAQVLAALGVRCACFVPATQLSYGRKAFAVVVAKRDVKTIFWRDAAVREGADGATMLLFKEGKLELPFADYRISFSDAEKIRRALDGAGVEDGDAVILGFGATRLDCERGAWAAAMAI